MTKVSGYLRSLFTCAVAVVFSAVFVFSGYAQSGPLTTDEIATYASKLKQAETAQDSLENRLSCFDGLEAEMIARRGADQIALGHLRKEQEFLKIQAEHVRSEYTEFLDTYTRAKYDLDIRQGELLKLLEAKRYRDETLRQCKEDIWIPLVNEVSCELSVRIVSMIDENLRQNEEGLGRAQRGYEGAWRNFQDAQGRLQTTEMAVQSVDARLGPIVARISQTEGNIILLARNLSILRIHARENDDLLDRFKHEMANARTATTDDMRARTAYLIRSTDRTLDAGLKTFASVLAEGAAVLPPDLNARCPAK